MGILSLSAAHLVRVSGIGLLGLALLAFSISPASAQGPGASQAQSRAELLRTQANPTYTPEGATSGEDQGYAVPSPNDKDLGEQEILKRAEQYKPFSFSVATPFYYTSNVALTDRGVEDDVVFAPGVSFVYQPRITKTLYGEIGVSQQFFVYDRFPGLDFGSFDVFVGVDYYLPQWHNLVLRARYDFNRLTDLDQFDEFFSDHALFFNAELPIRIGRAQQISIGADATISLHADPSPPGRHEFGFYAGYVVNVSRSFFLAAAGRLVVHDYYDASRTDVSEVLSLSANYHITDWLSASALTSFAWNQSDVDIFDYEVANVGAGLALNIRF